jgi:predicted nucleotidyltransferase
LEQEIIKLLEERGPLTGSGISNALDADDLSLWRICKLSKNLAIRTVGTRYLRLDRRIEDFARISPSILREFLTYSVVGLSRDLPLLTKTTARIEAHIREVSKGKSDLAYNIISALASRFDQEIPIKDYVCFILAGDIVYNMAHDVPRPERSTGKLVKGSDLDLVVVTGDRLQKSVAKRLDETIYREKYRLLIAPHLREEIDYVVKDLEKVKEQVRFDTYRHMVACKILWEGTLLYGSEEIFHRVKSLLREHGVFEKLAVMENRANTFRRKSIEILLCEDTDAMREENLNLFYPTEESEEFE